MISFGVIFILVCLSAIGLLIMGKGRSSVLSDHQGKAISLFMVIFIVGVVLIMTSYNGTLQLPLQFTVFHKDEFTTTTQMHKDVTPDDGYFYGAMFDAGSTGSRVHAFKFRETEKGKPFQLEKALFEHNSVGLSTFAEEPEKVAGSLQPLLDKAMEFVPESHWKDTPIALKATAGLRLLPTAQSEALLEEARKLLKQSPFKVGEKAVVIMEGDDEGTFSWTTLNFLTGVLGDINKMYGTMDLGGGSTQITFVPTSEQDANNPPPFPLDDVKLFGKTMKVYTHSYLGLGLMAGRYQTLGGQELSSSESGPTSFTSPCIAEGKTVKFKYQRDLELIGQKPAQGSRFEACYAAAKAVVDKHNVHKPPEVKTMKFTIFSYYYDRAADAKLIDESIGGDIKVGDFRAAAENECQNPKGGDLLCLDLTYISSLLQDGFNFSSNTTVSLRKKVNDFEVSWALGATFNMLKRS